LPSFPSPAIIHCRPSPIAHRPSLHQRKEASAHHTARSGQQPAKPASQLPATELQLTTENAAGREGEWRGPACLRRALFSISSILHPTPAPRIFLGANDAACSAVSLARPSPVSRPPSLSRLSRAVSSSWTFPIHPFTCRVARLCTLLSRLSALALSRRHRRGERRRHGGLKTSAAHLRSRAAFGSQSQSS